MKNNNTFSPIYTLLECILDIGLKNYFTKINKNYLQDETIDYIIQINGRKRTC